MRRLLSVVAATLLSGVFGLGGAPARAQLVPNPSFEDHSSCPTNFSQLALADQWDPTTNATPDYYHACGSGGFSVPGNSAGSQSAFQGDAYAGVTESAIIGLRDQKWGEIVVACVVAASGDAASIDEHCRQSALAGFKRPKAYLFVDKLPRNAANKVLRRDLCDLAAKANAGEGDLQLHRI